MGNNKHKQKMHKRLPLGVQISPVLVEIEMALWEMEFAVGEKPEYTDEGFRAAAKIFMSAMMDKMVNMQNSDKMSIDDRCKMATKLGSDLRQLIKTYADIDMHEAYKTFVVTAL